MTSGQNANEKMQTPQTPIQKNALPNPKTPITRHTNQWYFIHWRFVRDIMTGYLTGLFPISFKIQTHLISESIADRIVEFIEEHFSHASFIFHTAIFRGA